MLYIVVCTSLRTAPPNAALFSVFMVYVLAADGTNPLVCFPSSSTPW